MKKHKPLGEALASRRTETPPIAYFKRVAAIGFPIYHVEDFLLNTFASCVASGPVITRSHTLFANEEILWVVDIFVGPRLDTVDHLGSLAMSASRRRNERDNMISPWALGPEESLEGCNECRRSKEVVLALEGLIGTGHHIPGRKRHLCDLLPLLRSLPDCHLD